MARDNSCTFTVAGLIIRLSNVRFRPTVCGSNLLTSFRQASNPAPRAVFCTMSNASPSRSSASATWDHGCCHVLELESPILPRSRFGVKVHQLGECSRLDECCVSSGCSVLRLDFRSHLNIRSIPVPAFQHVRQLLRLLADFPTSSTIAVSLAVESSTAAGDSSQLAP